MKKSELKNMIIESYKEILNEEEKSEMSSRLTPATIKLEIAIPIGFEYILKDNAYELRNFIGKSLVKKWFGNGPFDVKVIK